MASADDTTNTGKIQEIIEKSGNGFHYKVVNFLREKGWSVLVSPYYNDNITDKPREVDIVAQKGFDVHVFGATYIGKVDIRLFIECKYINNEVVFWFDSVNAENLAKRIKSDIKIDERELSKDRYRFGCVSSVAKLFSSKPEKSQENDAIYKALSQSLNAMVYYKYRPSLFEERNGRVMMEVDYPVIVCSNFNKFYKIDTTIKDSTFEIMNADSFHLEVNYAFLDRNKENANEYFLVDVVNFDKLGIFLDKIEKDTEYIREHVLWEYNMRQRKRNDTSRSSYI